MEDESADIHESAEKILLFCDIGRNGDDRDLVEEVRTVSLIEGIVDFAKSYGVGSGAGKILSLSLSLSFLICHDYRYTVHEQLYTCHRGD